MSTGPLALAGALGLLSACAVGQHHVGYHDLGNGEVGWGAVGRASVEPLAAFEEACVKDVVAYRIAALRERFAPGLASQVTRERLTELDERFREAYRLDGTSERLVAMRQGRMLDEGVGKDAFRFYDFVGTRFALGGESGAVLTLLVVKVDGEPRLVGFEIADSAQEGDAAPFARFLVPESTDRAGLHERHTKALPH